MNKSIYGTLTSDAGFEDINEVKKQYPSKEIPDHTIMKIH